MPYACDMVNVNKCLSLNIYLLVNSNRTDVKMNIQMSLYVCLIIVVNMRQQLGAGM